MNDWKRKHLRLLISRLNKERKKQARQIDILCNDFVAAQKEFIVSLKAISFTANFYESITGLTDLNELLVTAAKHIQNQIEGANVVFFLPKENNFEMHIFDSVQSIDFLAQGEIENNDRRIENFFTAELVDNITASRRACSIDEMLAMGLQCAPGCLDKLTAAAIPLSCDNGSVGFLLLYRNSQKLLVPDEISCIGQITTGLARSIAACRNQVETSNLMD